MRHGHLVALIVALLVIASCSSVGPGSVRRDRVDYVGAVADSWKYQTLLNIVRLRYGDAPIFLDVSSVISSYTVQGTLMINGEIITDTTGSFVNPGAAASYTDKPTISYTPLTGDKFDKSLLRPLTPGTIFALIQAGWPADFVLRVTVRSINGIYNRASEGVQVRPADPEFYPLIEANSADSADRCARVTDRETRTRRDHFGVIPQSPPDTGNAARCPIRVRYAEAEA